MTKDEALKLALEALIETTALCENYKGVEDPDGYRFTEATAVIKQGNEAIAALRQAIEQAEYDNLTTKFGERAKEYLEEQKKSWKLEPIAVLKVWDEKEQKHVLINYHLTPPNKQEEK